MNAARAGKEVKLHRSDEQTIHRLQGQMVLLSVDTATLIEWHGAQGCTGHGGQSTPPARVCDARTDLQDSSIAGRSGGSGGGFAHSLDTYCWPGDDGEYTHRERGNMRTVPVRN
jgi:hypothetical protein